MTIKVGILTTHPIQYQVPWFRALSREPEIDLTVFFCMLPDAEQQGDGFGVAFEWDIPLLGGYSHRVLENMSRSPSVTTFNGCDTPAISRIVRDEGFHAFIANGWVAKSCLQLLLACRRYNVPCIVRGESNNLRPRPLWKRLLHRQLLRWYGAFLFIGEGNRRFYLDNGVPDERLFFAPYCVENERYATAAGEWHPHRDDLRAQWGIPSDAVVFLFCGKFALKKRPMDCIAALRTAVARLESRRRPELRSPIHLLMVGTGELLGACQAAARQDDLPVSFAGFLNQGEISRAYAVSDCLVLPSDDGETWGLVVNEAMACGLPAIVSDRVGCQRDLVTPGVTGEVFPVGAVTVLGSLMAELTEEPRRIASMGTAARARVARYNYEEVVCGTITAVSAVGCRLHTIEGLY